MAATPSTLISQANCYLRYANGPNDLLAMLIALLNTNNVSAQSLISQAQCYICNGANTNMLLAQLLVLLSPGGAGGQGGGVFSGNYGGGQPNFTPLTSAAIAIDTSNGTEWTWFNNQWQ